VVVSHVDGVEVASFPPKEFGAIDNLENAGDEEGVGDETKSGELVGKAADGNEGPGHHTESAVEDLFDLEVDGRVTFDSRIEIVDVFAGIFFTKRLDCGVSFSFDVGYEAKNNSQPLESENYVVEVRVDPRQIVPAQGSENDADEEGL